MLKATPSLDKSFPGIEAALLVFTLDESYFKEGSIFANYPVFSNSTIYSCRGRSQEASLDEDSLKKLCTQSICHGVMQDFRTAGDEIGVSRPQKGFDVGVSGYFIGKTNRMFELADGEKIALVPWSFICLYNEKYGEISLQEDEKCRHNYVPITKRTIALFQSTNMQPGIHYKLATCTSDPDEKTGIFSMVLTC